MGTRTGKLVMLVVVGLLAACGAATSSGTTQSGGSAATQSGGAGVSGTVTLNKEFWHSGFHVTLGQIQYTPAPKVSPGFYGSQQGKVVIQSKFENLGTDTAPFSPQMSMAVGGNAYTDADGQDQKLPEVPGKSTTNGVIAFLVDAKFDLAKAVLTIGTAKENQAVIPFGSSGQTVTLAPIKPTLTGSIVLAGLVKMDVTGAELSFDNVRNHREEDAGNQRLVAHFSVTGLGETCCITASTFSVKLPDGTASAADREDPCCGTPPRGTTKPDNSVDVVFKKADGSYDLIAKETVSGNPVTGDIMFTITNGSSSGGSSSGGGSTPGASPTASGH